MTTELRFERPGGVEICVDLSAGQWLYVRIVQTTGSGLEARCQHLASAQSIRLEDCTLVKCAGKWSLDIGDTAFHFEPDEAQQLQECFGLEVRHIVPRSAS